MGPGDLYKVICGLPLRDDPNLIVGLSRADDAAVYKLREDLAIVQTVDFIGPIVDDPYSFGMIAAANSLSDIYAMGGRPITAMNLVCFPIDTMGLSVLASILNGALVKLNEAETALVGGHSVKNNELRYGLSVTGIINPQKVITTSGAKEEDRLILTKPLGIGVMTTALKAGMIDSEVEHSLIDQMAHLNKEAAEVMISVGANACTDITGFGLIGHACRIAENSKVSLEFFSDKIPIIEGALEFARMGLIPAGAYSNRKFYFDRVEGGDVSPEHMDLFYDPQTSGGLLITVPRQNADSMLTYIKQAGYEQAAIVGRVSDYKEKYIIFR